MPEVEQLLGQVKDLTPDELAKFSATLPQSLDASRLALFVSRGMLPALDELPADKKTRALADAVSSQAPADRQRIIREIAGMPPPTPGARDRLWLIVVAAFALVLFGSFLALSVAVFTIGGKASPELILTMFTTVVGFLAGLFAPSPVGQHMKE